MSSQDRAQRVLEVAGDQVGRVRPPIARMLGVELAPHREALEREGLLDPRSSSLALGGLRAERGERE